MPDGIYKSYIRMLTVYADNFVFVEIKFENKIRP